MTKKFKNNLVRNFLNWTRAERARHPIGIPLKTVVVNGKEAPYQDLTSFDSDLVMRHVKKMRPLQLQLQFLQRCSASTRKRKN